MPKIQLPNTPNPSQAQAYGAGPTKRGRPMLFQVTDPMNRPIWPFLLALHCNPGTLSEKSTKNKNVAMTVGGFVEWIWPDDLDTLSASGSTGAFFGPGVGLTSGSDGRGAVKGRHGTMAWERKQDLLDLFRHNGVVYDGNGAPVIRGRVVCIFDRGIYTGFFTNFNEKEDDAHAWSFNLDWEFKVERLIYRFPFTPLDSDGSGLELFNSADSGETIRSEPLGGDQSPINGVDPGAAAEAAARAAGLSQVSGQDAEVRARAAAGSGAQNGGVGTVVTTGDGTTFTGNGGN